VELDSTESLPRPRSASTASFNSRPRARGLGHPAGSRAVLLVAGIAIALAFSVAAYGVETSRENIAMIGLAATVVIAVGMAVSARNSIRRTERFSEFLDGALSESERVRHELQLANEDLRRENAGLRTRELAVAQGFDLVDERTQGRLRELVEETGAELAEIVDEALDRPGSGA
jgi:hypothetical protein